MAGKRKARLAAFNRTGILETANELFLQNGVAGTTMDEIARTAGYSKTTIYAYFKSKEDIFNHLILAGMELFRDQVRLVAEKESSFKDFYFDFCKQLTAMHDSNQVYFEGMTGNILCSETDTKNDAVLNKIYLIGEETSKIIEIRMLQGISAKEIEIDVPRKEMMMAFWFFLIGVIEKASNKKDYIKRNLGKTRDEFLQSSFQTLLQLLTKRKER